MIPETSADVDLEIAHVLFMDIVGYSKLLTDQQRELLNELNKIVRETPQFKQGEAAGKLIRLPTGDGMALAFFTNPEAALKCAIEINHEIRNHPDFPLRMGLHSGPVSGVTDVNDRSNVAGAGINMAQRVMDCGDAGHILLSSRIADDLAQQSRWRPSLHELGPVKVKHGVKVELVNFYTDEVGNPELPDKVKRAQEEQSLADRRVSQVGRRKPLWILATLLLLTGAVIGLRFLLHQPGLKSTAAVSIPDKSIAVLPLENLSDEKENAYFAAGIQDELLTNLAKIRNLKVISRTSVMQYKSGITRNLKEIAQQLGVANVVEGSVRRSGDHLRVSVQLIDALTDRHIWAQNYDRTVADSVALQGELATEMAAAIGATLSPQEKARVEATPTKNASAYQAYLRGRAAAAGWTGDFSNTEKAAKAYQEAVTLDPNFALAWAYLSWADSMLYWEGVDPTSDRLAAAKNAMNRAIALDPDLPEIHLSVGYYHYYGLRDFKGALSEFQLAEQGLPNNVDVLMAIGYIQRRFTHFDEVIAVMRRAVELDPRNMMANATLANAYRFERRYSEAIAVADHMLAVEPSNIQAIELKTFCFWGMGNVQAVDLFQANLNIPPHFRGHQALAKHDFAQAADFFSRALTDKPANDEKREILLDLGFAQKRAGNVAASKAAYQQAVQEITQDLHKADAGAGAGLGDPDEMHCLLGIAYAGLGDAARAVSEGQKGMELRPTSEDPYEGPEREEQMAQIYALLGNADEAIPILKRWVQVPSATSITPALLRIEPIWDPIRNDPRFQELVAEKKP